MTERPGGTPPLLVLGKIKSILGCFSVERPELTLSEIARMSGVQSSTCQRLVHNLVREGFLDRTGDKHRIGLAFVRWAAPGTLGLDLVTQTRPALVSLSEESGETACLYVRDRGLRTVVGVAQSRHVVVRLFRVGMVMPLHAGAPGKIFLAFDQGARADALAAGLHPYTTSTPTDVDMLDSQVAKAKQDGYAVALDERDDGAGSVSAPVFDHEGELAAVIGIGAPTQRLAPEDITRLVPLVRQAATRASRALGL
ncbi:IclR family transcriptional regulator [Arthrobacter sp. NPDC090010]|uniref:IclR family transcriptional regulator n=1 Tax=Arthrobacter sp. NPDC090010 TaxID=3363942 RepID=UPI0037F76D86